MYILKVRKFLDTKGHDPNHAHAEAIKQCCKQVMGCGDAEI